MVVTDKLILFLIKAAYSPSLELFEQHLERDIWHLKLFKSVKQFERLYIL